MCGKGPSINDVRTFTNYFDPLPPPQSSHSVTQMTSPLEKDVPNSFTPLPLFFLIHPKLQALGTKNTVKIEYNLEALDSQNRKYQATK